MDKIILSALLAGVLAAGAEEELSGLESWGGRKAHPAVVNAVTAIPDDPWTLSLRGEWLFVATPSGNRRNTPWANVFKPGADGFWSGRPQWGGKVFPTRKIQVPSCWESQLTGEEVFDARPWFCIWDCSPLKIHGLHDGDGWYRRWVDVPAAWQGRRLWLKTGWVNSQGWFWVNGTQVAMDQNCCATFKYDITDILKPGTSNLVVVQVNNIAPSHRGCMNSKHHWGGILRDLELEATPSAAWIDDAWVRGDFDAKTATVHVTMGFEGAVDPKKLRVTIDGETVEQPIEQANNPNNRTIEAPLRDFRAWSPEHPNLYTAKVELVSAEGLVLQQRFERFGVRKLERRGREIFLNNHPFGLRGAGWHAIDPIEGYAKPDRAVWRKRARQIRDAGFNIVRNHSEIKMPEFYEACDEVGLMVEAELPYYGDVAADAQRFDPLADVKLLYEHYRRYPSFAIYSFGNEGSFGKYLSPRLFREVKARDPDRLVVGQDGGVNLSSDWPVNNPTTSDFAGAPLNVTPRGVYCPELPYFYHEYINSSVKLDSRVADGFTGVWAAPISRASRLAFLSRFGLDHAWGDRLQDGQNHMQKIYLKYGIESARLDFNACGFCYWSLQDACSPQGDTFIGQALWDPFWNEKRCGSKTADVAVYNSPSCVLRTDLDDPQVYDPKAMRHFGQEAFLDSTITNLVRQAGERLRLRFHFVHYGEEALVDARLVWKFTGPASGGGLPAGERVVGAVPLGGVRPIGDVEIVVPDLARAAAVRLVARVEGRTILGRAFAQENGWDYWFMPARKAVDGTAVVCEGEFFAALSPRYPGLRRLGGTVPAGVKAAIVKRGGELERQALAAGVRTISLANQKTKRNVTLGWWYMTEQMGAALKECPEFAPLPHDGLFGPLFFRIGKEGLPLPVEGFTAKDALMVGEGGKGCYLYAAGRTLPNGAKHYLVAGLDLLAATPEGTAILDGLLLAE